jgi:hypothetical protein
VETVLPEKPTYSRRFSARVELYGRGCIYWSCAGEDDVSLILNLSIGGLFITTLRPRCLGATAILNFLVPDGPIRAEAIICHIIPRIGLGLKFTALVKEDRPHLAALMARLRGSSSVRLDSSNSLLRKDNGEMIDLTNELDFEK